ncbi:hypothetical protein A7C99_5576 [Trichophyton rubrum]|uniref:Uncharacterized protein n=3 Tax=Trichophyton TaxID=5550 RepID=A0A178EV72_TRIRU|nr:hypothetical protein A7C99_5576 [Trichophyton rubrum]
MVMMADIERSAADAATQKKQKHGKGREAQQKEQSMDTRRGKASEREGERESFFRSRLPGLLKQRWASKEKKHGTTAGCCDSARGYDQICSIAAVHRTAVIHGTTPSELHLAAWSPFDASALPSSSLRIMDRDP